MALPFICSLQLAAVLPGLCLIAICIIPLGRLKLRAVSEPWLARIVSKQLSTVLKVQAWRCAPLDALAHASAATVSIEGYLICLPLLFLVGYEDEACLLASALALVTHVTCALKDLLCGPRPGHACQQAVHDEQVPKASQPHIRAMEADREVEFGCPSMHSALVLAMNGYAVYLIFQHAAASPGPSPAGVTWPWLQLLLGCALAWVALVMWGRMYLGVHSPVDLATGAAVGMSLLCFWLVVGQAWLTSIKTQPWAFGLHLVGCIWLLAAYPKPPIHTASYTFTTVFCGAELGVAGPFSAAFVASPVPNLLKQAVHAAPPQLALMMSRVAAGADIACLCYRLLGGVTVVLMARSLSKAVLVPVLPVLFQCLPTRIRAVLQPPVSVDYASIGERIRRRDAAAAAATAAVADSAPAAKRKDGYQRGGVIRRLLSKRSQREQAEPTNGPEALSMVSSCTVKRGDLGKEENDKARGVLLRPDGYPWDADICRRVGSYFCAVASLVVYVRTLQAAAEMVSSS